MIDMSRTKSKSEKPWIPEMTNQGCSSAAFLILKRKKKRGGWKTLDEPMDYVNSLHWKEKKIYKNMENGYFSKYLNKMINYQMNQCRE